ncbi:MAG: phosphatase PAP2 family protein [Bacteroidota bacterium]
MRPLLASLLLGLWGLSVAAQSDRPYALQWELDLPLTLGGMGLAISGEVSRNAAHTTFTEAEILALSRQDINGFDRSATHRWSPTINTYSDVLLTGSYVIPLSFLLHRTTRQNILPIALIASQTLMITSGLTNLTKGAVDRKRPFLYKEDVALSERVASKGPNAFFSGHTSVATASLFMTAKVFHDHCAHPGWRKVVWASAATLSASMAWARYAAGKHFPTDVIVGYAVGASVGILIPALHKKRDASSALQVYPVGVQDGAGIGMRYRF